MYLELSAKSISGFRPLLAGKDHRQEYKMCLVPRDSHLHRWKGRWRERRRNRGWKDLEGRLEKKKMVVKPKKQGRSNISNARRNRTECKPKRSVGEGDGHARKL